MMIPIGTPCVIVESAYMHLRGAYCTVVAHYPLVPGTNVRYPNADHEFHVPADSNKPVWAGLASNVRPIGPPPRETTTPPIAIKPPELVPA